MSGYAERGPVPKRSQARRRRNKTDENGDSVEVQQVELDMPPVDHERYRVPPNPDWHPAAQAVWASAMESGMVIFWEPSDYAILRLTCDQISQEYADDLIIEKVKEPMEAGQGGGERLVHGSRPMPAGKFSAVMKTLGALGLTEGDRRRMRLELERHGEPVDQGSEEDLVKDRLTLLEGGRKDVG